MDSLKEAWRSIFRRPGRSALTISSIAVGILSVMVIGAVGQIGKALVQSELSGLGLQSMLVSASDAALTREELELVKKTPHVAGATPLALEYSTAAAPSGQVKSLVWGVDANIPRMISMTLVHGRLFTQADIRSAAKLCLVEESFAQEQYHRSNIVGKTIRIAFGSGEEEFTVAGVVSAGGGMFQSMMGESVPMFLYLPYTTHQLCTGRKGFERIALRAGGESDPGLVRSSLSRALDQHFGWEGSVAIEDLNQYAGQLSGLLDLVTAILAAAAGVSLFVAGLSIMTAMLSSVGERTWEIGVKKSIGASAQVIVGEFLLEAVLLSGIGAVFGIGAGALAGWAGCLALGVGYSFPLKLAGICLACALLTGGIFGAYPAQKAAALRPIEALNS